MMCPELDLVHIHIFTNVCSKIKNIHLKLDTRVEYVRLKYQSARQKNENSNPHEIHLWKHNKLLPTVGT
jgi:hypothetical protein